MAEKKRFRKEPKRYALTFEDGELDGFECTMGAVTLGQFTEMTALADQLATPEGRTPENIEAQFVFMAGLLVEWNLDDACDQPVPPTYEGLKTLEFDFVQQILKGYMTAIASVPKDSGETSNGGGISPERSLGLAAVSASRRN